jgi:hypothetical protein
MAGVMTTGSDTDVGISVYGFRTTVFAGPATAFPSLHKMRAAVAATTMTALFLITIELPGSNRTMESY